jgi:uncharacterized protein YoxC
MFQNQEKTKLSDNELQLIKLIRQDSFEAASALGELTYQMTLLDHQIKGIKTRVVEIKDRENSLLEELKEKYGNVTINIETGEIE